MIAMSIIMNNINISSIEEIEQFNRGSVSLEFKVDSRKEKYDLIRSILVTTGYIQLSKSSKSIVKTFLRKITAYTAVQLKRLIRTWKKDGLPFIQHKPVGSPPRKYTSTDIDLLIQTDNAHGRINGIATKKILERQYHIFNCEEYKTISGISVSHIYNLRRNSKQYISNINIHYTKTKPTSVNIGERCKPIPCGKPGFLRVDSVHQGDKEGKKGVYHINIVDEVLQWEIIGCVPAITDEYMEPLLEQLLASLPFVVYNFHSDNGSEYINQVVAKILERLRIKQTKSRSRKSTDNALVEGKNGAIVRKHMGRNFIAKEHYVIINEFYQNHMNIYLNYHRTCLYATDYCDKRGKIKKKYNQCNTPYNRFKELTNAESYLKPGITFAQLDKIAYAESDNICAKNMQSAKSKLLEQLQKQTSKVKGVSGII